MLSLVYWYGLPVTCIHVVTKTFMVVISTDNSLPFCTHMHTCTVHCVYIGTCWLLPSNQRFLGKLPHGLLNVFDSLSLD